jgi:hypothetical protein
MAITQYAGAGGGDATWAQGTAQLASAGDIMYARCDGTAVDGTGNHTFDLGTYGSSASGYGADTVMDTTGANTDVSSNESAHRLATASAVSVGGMVYWTGSGSDYIISSAVGNGSGNHNYSVLAYTGNRLWLQTGPAGTLYDTGFQLYTNRWYHIAVCWAAGRTTAEVYVNGQNVDSAVSLTAGDQNASDNLSLMGINQTAGGEFTGYGRNFFVASSQLSASVVADLSEEAFGHVQPTAGLPT